MRKPFSEEFFKRFKEGYKLFERGNWSEAKKVFEMISAIKGCIDFPTKNLLAVMEETNYNAPADWRGYRALTEK